MNRKPLSKSKRLAVYKKYNGKCAYCGCELGDIRNMAVDHIEAVCRKSNRFTGDCKFDNNKNSIENLNPACRACNQYKSSMTIEGFRLMLANMLNDNPQYLFQSTTKMNCCLNYGTVTLSKWDKIFYFEKLNDTNQKPK